MRASRSGRCTPAWTPRPEQPLPGDWPFVRGGDALRDVKSGWKVAEAFPAPGQKAVTDGNGAVLVALTEGVSALVLRVGCTRRRRGRRAGPPARGRVSRPGAADPRRWLRISSPPPSAVLPQLTDMDDDQRARLSIDLGADPLTAPLSKRPGADVADVVATAGEDRRIRRWRAGHHRRRARAAQPRRQRVVGAGRSRRRGRRLPAAARRGWAQRGGFVAADQFPAGRRRRPVHDDRQIARAAPTLGQGGRGGRRARRRRRPRARGHVDADDGAARSVGEHASHHGRRVRRGCRRRGHRARAAVRRGDPRRIARHRSRVSRAGSPATPNCCCWRSRISVGCSTRQAVHGSSRTSPSSSPSRPGSTSSRSRRRAASPRPATSSPRRSPRFATGAPTTSTTAARRSPASTNIRTSVNRRCRNMIRRAPWRGTPAGFEALRDRSDAYLDDDRVSAEGAVAAAGSARGAQHSCDVRHQPARVGRHRGGQPGHRRRRRSSRRGFGRGRPRRLR